MRSEVYDTIVRIGKYNYLTKRPNLDDWSLDEIYELLGMMHLADRGDPLRTEEGVKDQMKNFPKCVFFIVPLMIGGQFIFEVFNKEIR